MTMEERFMSHIKKTATCWQWDGYLYHGYGKFKVDDRLMAAHRLAYELFVGPIPNGTQIDHTCHNQAKDCNKGSECLHRSCVNPRHLEPVTEIENKLRSPNWLGNRKLCKRGHEFDTTRSNSNGQRTCHKCMRLRDYKYRHAFSNQ